MTEIVEIRKLAEEFAKAESGYRVNPIKYEAWERALTRYEKATKPATIIELLDRLEAAEAVCEQVDKTLKASNFTAGIENLRLISLYSEWQKVRGDG